MDKYEIAARIEIEEMDGFTGKMPAAQQKKIFGGYIFGKKTIAIDATNQGQVSGSFKVGFGEDANHFRFSFDQIANAVNGTYNLSF